MRTRSSVRSRTGRVLLSVSTAGLLVLATAACSASTANGSDSAARSVAPTTGSAGVDAAATSLSRAAAASIPRPAHVVVVVEENHSYRDIVGSRSAPYLNSLARTGASFTAMYAVRHPSQPNYVALFSGSTHGLSDDSCPHTYTGASLGSQLLAAHHSFAGYSEGLPRTGSTTCSAGAYARKHAPWADFSHVPASANRPLTAFPRSYAMLPALSFVIPNLDHDMHDGSVSSGDSWLRAHLGGYVSWARTHNSLLVVTWDEDDYSEANRVLTIVAGAHVRAVRYTTHTDHYGLLRTLQALFGLPGLGASAARVPVTGIWTG